jgi:CubicO group peptidase (beta-lactamase class C family)
MYYQITIQPSFSENMTYKISSICLKCSAVGLFLLFFQCSVAQSVFKGLDDMLTQKQKVTGPDMVLMVASKDTVVYQKANKTFTPKTQALIGASSQWLTVALVLQQVDEGKISLDDKVSKYLPVFASYMKSYLTIRHCLSSFTGIQSEQPKVLRLFEKKKFASLEEEVNDIVKKHIQANPGEEFHYSSFGIDIAARVLEVAGRKKFDMLAQQKLFRPLGMRQTTFSTLDASAVDPSNGARSSASDYMRFLTMLLNNGMYKGQRILSENAVKEMRQIQATADIIKAAPNEVKGFDYALGAWAPEHNNKEAAVLTSPSFGGTTPFVDFCRGYAALVLLKDLSDDPKTNIYPEIKKELDAKFSGMCK